jgi:hypothetical protein
MRLAVLVILVCGLLMQTGRADEAVPADAELRWWKGNLHTHTYWSDGDDFPEMVAEWYRNEGYHFLALSDHNILSEGQRWVPLRELERRSIGIALEKYLERFGEHWVETREGEQGREVRLKPLDEFRHLVEERGRFIMIQSEEISAGFREGERRFPIHINATNIGEVIRPLGGDSVRDVMRKNLEAVEEQAERLGREILPHINHPNFRWAITAEDLAHVLNEHFFEVYNGHPLVNHEGDELRPGVERMWDIANTIRIAELESRPLYGLATDDTHHHHHEGMARSNGGRGWVMVRARHLTPESLIRAMRARDFYASSGVELRDVRFDAETGLLEIEIEPGEDGETFVTEFIGTRREFDPASEARVDEDGVEVTRRYSDDIGMVFERVEGVDPSYRLTGDELYVRATVTSSHPPVRPSFEGQKRQAWTQPVIPRERGE